MSDLANMRREVTVILDGVEYVVKPSLQKALDIETAFGPIPALIQNRFGMGTAGVREVVDLMAIMMRGVKGAPNQQKVRDIVFAEGMVKHIPHIVTFLSNAIRTDEPSEAEPEADPKKDSEGN